MAAAGADSQQSPQPTVAELRAQLEEANAARRAAEAALKSEREQREAEAARHRDEEASLRGDNQRLHARLLAAVRAQLTPQPELKLLMAEDDEGRERQQMVQQEKQERGAMREGNVEVRKAPYRQGRGLRVSAMFTLSEVAYRVATYHPLAPRRLAHLPQVGLAGYARGRDDFHREAAPRPGHEGGVPGVRRIVPRSGQTFRRPAAVGVHRRPPHRGRRRVGGPALPRGQP
eukprot:TRINITY_DN13275_c0_g1_i2.p1 TRINITY_DN13275_c0_g1~~TRINITY_DN13275_c0_g1_i2.p1  ORF type:complete len:265 (+),score=44.99 TRINITY_DN13275_c0_g1_i2:103-795(+)